MNKKLRITALVLGTCVTAMAGMALAGCGDENPDPKPTPTPSEKKITDGIFDGSIVADNGTANPGYIRFHEKDEVVEGKAIFYCLFGSENAGTQGAGFYTVEEKPYDYTGSWATKNDKNADNDDKDNGGSYSRTISGSAKYTVTLTSFAGETYSTFGYEDGKLYDFDAGTAAPAAANYNHYIFEQKDDNGKEEFAVTLYSFVNTENEERTFVISHNGSYADDVSASYTVNGTWKLSGSTYTLTPDDEEDKGGTFVPAADNLTGTLTVDGVNYTLGQKAAPNPVGATIVEDLEDTGATAQFGGYMYKLTVNSDLTWAIKVGGQAAITGTWTFANYALTLTYEGGSVSTNPAELQTLGLVIRITLPVGEGTGECVYTIGADKVGAIMAAVEANQVHAIVEDLEDTGATAQFGGYMYRLTVNDDLTWAIKVGGQAAITGTWTFANYALTLTYDGGSVSTNPAELQTLGLVIRITLPVGEGTGECVYTIGADKVGALMEAVA